MFFKLLTHLSIKHYVKHMTTKQLQHFLMSYENIQCRTRNNKDLSLQVAFNLMMIFRPYVFKENKKRK